MQTAVILISSRDPGYLRIWEHIARRELVGGRQVVMLDATGIAAAPVDSYHRGVLRLGRLPYPGHDRRERFEALGASVRRIEEFLEPGDDRPLDDDAEAELAIAVGSVMASYFRNDLPDPRRRRVRRMQAAVRDEGRRVFAGVSRAVPLLAPGGVVFVPNGRAPSQRMAALATRRVGAGLLHIEKGESPDAAFLRPYSPHDRLASQESIAEVLAGLSRAQIRSIAEDWMRRRDPGADSRNQFASLWDSASVTPFPRDATVVGFFTSSQDEFQSLGPDWEHQEWTSQLEAFDAAITHLEANGMSCYLRVHPNLATKSHAYFRRERSQLRALAAKHPTLRVIWHDDPVNSYALLEASDGVVVWTSTIGLEASARGLPVWALANSRYGMTADITEVFSAAALARAPLEPRVINTDGAHDFIAYLVLRDEQLTREYRSWLPWDEAKPPLPAKIAAVLASGGAPYARDAVASVFDNYRHRRLRANLRHLAGR